MTDFPTILFDLVQNTFSVRFSYLHWLNYFCKGPRNMPKFPQKYKKIAKCCECAVYVVDLQSPPHLANPFRNDQV